MPAVDVVPLTHGSGAIEHRPAGSSSGGGTPVRFSMQSIGYAGPGWKTSAPPPEKVDNEGMEVRIKALETFALDARDRLVRLETKIDMAATREDLHKEIGAQTWRIVGAMLTIGAAMSAAVFFIARNVQ